MVGLSSVSFAYDGREPAIKGVSLDIAPGRCTALVGANGAGKSTLLLLLAGIVRPDAGRLMVDGVPAAPGTLRGRVGLVLQNPDDQLFGSTVKEDLTFGPLNLGMSMDDARLRAEEVMRRMGISDYADTPVHGLSHGMKKKVAVAGVLAMRPEMILLDEPFAGLDPDARRSVNEMVVSIAGAGHTVVIATHDLDRALGWAEDALVLHSGRLAASGRASDVLVDDAVLAPAGLDLPASVRVLREIEAARESGRSVPEEIVARILRDR